MAKVVRQLSLFACLVAILTVVPWMGSAYGQATCFDVFSPRPRIVRTLETAVVISFEKAQLDGKTEHYLVVLEGGQKAIFKPAPEHWGPNATRDVWARKANPEAEVIAYEIDRVLGLGQVPPTVVRTIQGMRGSLQAWVEADGSKPRLGELEKLSAFDYLLNNIDRTGANFRATENSRNLLTRKGRVVAIDNSLSLQPLQDFQKQPTARDPVAGLDLGPLHGSFADGLRQLSRDRLRAIMKDPRYDEVIREIMVRRNRLRARLAETPRP
ncbi:MAG: hypothetical protein V4760_10100 [Bdellovibrionota bacterium]